jgi:hypothetical protein
MFANCQAGGTDSCFPDLCKTPPAGVPVPYPNIALGCTAVGFVPHVLFQGAPAHSLATTIPMTTGDEAGAMLGATSQLIKAPCRHTVGSAKMILAGMPAVRMTSASTQNNNNGFGARVAPSQVKVMVMS